MAAAGTVNIMEYILGRGWWATVEIACAEDKGIMVCTRDGTILATAGADVTTKGWDSTGALLPEKK